jgi:hypothetical protein
VFLPAGGILLAVAFSLWITARVSQPISLLLVLYAFDSIGYSFRNASEIQAYPRGHTAKQHPPGRSSQQSSFSLVGDCT